jgi:hypothetical protein
LVVRSRKILHFISLIFLRHLDPLSRAATPEISPARKCGETDEQRNRVSFRGRHSEHGIASQKDEVSQGKRSMAQSLLPFLTTTSAAV